MALQSTLRFLSYHASPTCAPLMLLLLKSFFSIFIFISRIVASTRYRYKLAIDIWFVNANGKLEWLIKKQFGIWVKLNLSCHHLYDTKLINLAKICTLSSVCSIVLRTNSHGFWVHLLCTAAQSMCRSHYCGKTSHYPRQFVRVQRSHTHSLHIWSDLMHYSTCFVYIVRCVATSAHRSKFTIPKIWSSLWFGDQIHSGFETLKRPAKLRRKKITETSRIAAHKHLLSTRISRLCIKYCMSVADIICISFSPFLFALCSIQITMKYFSQSGEPHQQQPQTS